MAGARQTENEAPEMTLTNIRHIVEPVSDFHAATQISPPLRVPRYSEYAKANQRWWIELRFNSEADLAVFEKAVRGSFLRLVELKRKFYLEDPRIPDTAEMGAVFHHVDEHLPRLHAAIAIQCPHYVPARCHAVAELSESGSGRSIVHTQVIVHGRDSVQDIRNFLGLVEGGVEPSLIRADQDQDFSEALFFFGADGNPWSNLYKVVEIVDEVVTKNVAVANGWCPDSQWRRFKHTANHQEAIGRFSRHARMNSEPPADPMSLDEARQFVLKLLRSWLDTRRPAE